jgi:tRNA threonylcarbamoyl adenosine modification protein YeaZ
MLLLAADTSGKHGSIALAKCGPDAACSVIEVVPLDGGTFSAQLVPQIAALLAKHGFSKQDIAGFGVVSGPGSFTGLRIGLAAIKALAEVLAKPIAAVSLLEAIVVSGRSQGKVIAALDAGRGDVYAGEYEVNGRGAHLVRERLLTRSELMESVGSIVVTTDHSRRGPRRGVTSRRDRASPQRCDRALGMAEDPGRRNSLACGTGSELYPALQRDFFQDQFLVVSSQFSARKLET